MEERKYRSDLPEVPERLRSRPIVRGYPVPWFVDDLKDEGGEPDFRIADGRKLIKALKEGLCWVCGQRLGSTFAFTIGPMCAVQRVNSEPPSHKECAVFSAIACPFLNQKEKDYRDGGKVDELKDQFVGETGCLIKRQPGAVGVWVTKKFKLVPQPNGTGFLFGLGKPDEVLWFAHGRPATRAEVAESIESGLPLLQENVDKQGWVMQREFEEQLKAVYDLLPPVDPPPRFRFGSAARDRVLGG
jgi:hypothetical protein